jgi:RNA polymerase sigma-70 factor (ECF subfamily)
MSGLSDGVSSALDALLGRFRGMVLQVGARHRLSADEVDDVLQEIRIRLWRAHGTGERIGGVSASYLYRTALTAALGVIRRRRRGLTSVPEEVLDTVDSVQAAPSQPASPAQHVEMSELAQVIDRTIAQLAPDRQAAVRLHLAGYDRRETADLMHWSEGRTRNLLSRGLADLRLRLLQQGITAEAEAT